MSFGQGYSRIGLRSDRTSIDYDLVTTYAMPWMDFSAKDVVSSLFLRGPCVMEVDVACPRGAMTCAIGEVFVS